MHYHGCIIEDIHMLVYCVTSYARSTRLASDKKELIAFFLHVLDGELVNISEHVLHVSSVSVTRFIWKSKACEGWIQIEKVDCNWYLSLVGYYEGPESGAS